MTTKQLYATVGARIRKARLAAGLTQGQLAKKAKLTRCSITNIESGFQRIMLHSLMAAAKALDVEAIDLIPTSDEPTEKRGRKLGGVRPVKVRHAVAVQTWTSGWIDAR